MTKKLLLFRYFSSFCVILIFTQFVYAQAEYPRAVNTYLRLNEDNKQVKASKISITTEVLSTNGKEDTIKYTIYDSDGYIVKEYSKLDTSAEKSGQFVNRNLTFIYNIYKLLTEKIDSSESQVKKYYLKYDDLYNITSEEMFVNNKLAQKYEYEYDDLSRLIESNLRDLVQECRITENYDYDSYNNLVKITTRNKCPGGTDKPVEVKYNYAYDKDYRILEKKTILPGSDFRAESFTYTPEGKPASSSEIIGTNFFIKRLYTYDKNSVRIQKTQTKEELSTVSDLVIKYDNSGNRLIEEYYDPEGKILYTYKFIYTYYK
ncbi:MAG TPA: hypothetical protein PK753_11020 [Ignavibacteria bacterium]|nr:hypothetical protein [Ignavibacteria bacterium]